MEISRSSKYCWRIISLARMSWFDCQFYLPSANHCFMKVWFSFRFFIASCLFVYYIDLSILTSVIWSFYAFFSRVDLACSYLKSLLSISFRGLCLKCLNVGSSLESLGRDFVRSVILRILFSTVDGRSPVTVFLPL